MPTQRFIDVRIEVDGQPLAEYQDPDDAADTDHEQTRYIEVKTGQKFSVKVAFLPGFDVYKTRFLEGRVTLDQENCYNQRHWDLRTHRKSLRHGVLPWTLQQDFSFRKLKERETGIWHNYDFTFGALALTESANWPSDLSPSDAQKIGSVCVEVFRARRETRDVPYVWDQPEPEGLEEISEKLLKGSGVKNSVRFEKSINASPPEPQVYKYVPISGAWGAKFRFVFKYRSRATLQRLGCIPRSPSPQPDPILMLERTEDMLRLSKEQARQQNLRILELEERLAQATPDRRSRAIVDLDDGDSPPLDKQQTEMDEMKSEDDPVYLITTNRHQRGIKSEEEAHRAKRPRICVDLTDD